MLVPVAFGVGPADLAIIFIIALILFGPKKLPELGQQIGQALREFRKVADDVTGATDSIRSEVAGAAQSFRRQVDEVRSAAALDSSVSRPPLTLTSSAVTPAEHTELMQPVVRDPDGPQGLKISTAPPAEPSNHSDEKG
jgi:sec-independent protein translocase protein TatA